MLKLAPIIIDLSITSDWKRKGFLDKVFTENEKHIINQSIDPTITVWQFWSMKEAAYKALCRNSNAVFNPLLFFCSADRLVQYNGQSILTNTIIDGDIIHTIATTSQNVTTYLNDNTLDYINKFNLANLDIELKKDANGLPVILDKVTGETHIASISHHNRFLGVVYNKKPCS
ncbi:MAG: 4-phosphopantetheinyl transferase family protein [Flavobacterium sp.]|nr:MAG: 4-phosphopantetheinyl transferase family protein [Flavobacterium sp.]